MKIYVVAGIFFLIQSYAFAQSISDLQKKKQDAAEAIEYTTRLLNATQRNEHMSLGQLQLINSKINQRSTIISATNNEIDIYNNCIANNTLAIKLIENDITKLKEEYAALVKLAYKNKNASDEWLFLLSSESFNQAYRRYLYFRRYTAFRQNQAKVIGAVEEVLHKSILKLEQQKNVKQQLVGETQKETQKLAKEQKEQNSELQKLKSQKQGLQYKLAQQRRVEQQLERKIQQIIEEEARRSREAGGPGFALTPEQKLTGTNFEQNQQKLPWPVERGIIIEHFGVHQHPILTNVQVQNNGITIATETGAKVRAVFTGEVSRVFGITGGNTAVIIRHGKYLSVYSNLREVLVKKGDNVSTKQTIGTVFTDQDDGNKSILKFQIWKESTKLDPEQWIVQ